jgi:hypothetical protein
MSAMNHEGMLAAMTIEAATGGDIFLKFLDPVLCPKLQPGGVLIMDNLSAHKVEGVKERIEAAGARILYLPPLLAGPQHHRKSLVQTQSSAPGRQSANHRGSPPSRRKTPS